MAPFRLRIKRTAERLECPSSPMSAEPTITPSAKDATARAWAGVDIPNPTATGHGETAFNDRTNRGSPEGNARRVPVTPVRETAYRNPRVFFAINFCRATGVVGATR